MNRLFNSAASLGLLGIILTPCLVEAGGPGFGGGGWSWGSAATTALGAARAIQGIRGANGNNNNGHGPGVGILPRNSNGRGQQNFAPQNTVVQPRANTPPVVNAPPAVNVLPQKAVVAVQPQANTGAAQHLVTVTAADLARMQNELKDQNTALLNDVGRQISAAINSTIDKLPDAANLPAADRTRLQTAVESGNAAAVANLLPPDDRNSPAGQALTDLAEARQAVDAVRSALTAGTLRMDDLIDLTNALNGALAADAVAAVGQIVVNQQVIIWVAAAQPGANAIPMGNNVPIALVPGLAPGQILPLGFGPVLIGIGNAGGPRIMFGQGNVWQAAGLPAPIAPPMPDYDGGSMAGAVVLANSAANAVKYSVNQSPYEMQPEYSQNLGAGEWLVEFDRGGGYGTARYTLTDGYYAFEASEKGWELYKQSFDAELQNGNDFDFHYVLENTRYVLGAKQLAEFSGSRPFVVRFENGNGEFVQKKLKDGTYVVAVTDRLGLDVYTAESIAPPSVSTQSLASVASPDVSTVSLGLKSPTAPAAPTASGAPAASSGFKLPAGFQPIDPIELLTKGSKTTSRQPLPAAFSLFAAGEGGE